MVFTVGIIALVLLTGGLASGFVWLHRHRASALDAWFMWSAVAPYVLCWGIPMAIVSFGKASYELVIPIILGALLSAGVFITGLVLIGLRLKKRQPVIKLVVWTLLAAGPAVMVFGGVH